MEGGLRLTCERAIRNSEVLGVETGNERILTTTMLEEWRTEN